MTQKSKKSTQKYQSKKVPETLILQGILALSFPQTVKNRIIAYVEFNCNIPFEKK